MRAKTLGSCLALSLLCCAGAAQAQYTNAQREACTPDVFRLCGQHIPDAGAITACLRREKARLSPACRGVFSAAGRSRPVADADSF